MPKQTLKKKSVTQKNAAALPKKKKHWRKIELDREQVTKLAEWGCTAKEIAAFFRVSEDTIHRNYQDCIVQGNEAGNVGLRRAQYLLATQARNATMLIWLGKQRLGQADKFDVGDPGDGQGFTFSFRKHKDGE